METHNWKKCREWGCRSALNLHRYHGPTSESSGSLWKKGREGCESQRRRRAAARKQCLLNTADELRISSQQLWEHAQDLCKPRLDRTPAWRGMFSMNLIFLFPERTWRFLRLFYKRRLPPKFFIVPGPLEERLIHEQSSFPGHRYNCRLTILVVAVWMWLAPIIP